jgi:hypothetical protein
MEEMAELLREAEPKMFAGYRTYMIARYCMFYMMCKWGLTQHVDIEGFEDGESSIEYLEEAYKRGWAAVLHDGKLIGFRKERTP